MDFWLNPANAETASDIQKPLFRQAMIAWQGYWVAIAHVPFPGIGHLRPNFKGYTWLPAHYSRAPWGGSP